VPDLSGDGRAGAPAPTTTRRWIVARALVTMERADTNDEVRAALTRLGGAPE
jgi:hypothetical protein